jgi:CBS domain-containing protein
MPRSFSGPLLREAPVLSASDSVSDALRKLLDSGLPALPVVGDDGRFAGVFGEREFFAALFPGYLGQLQGSGFLTRSIEAALDKRAACALEPVGDHMTTEHVEVRTDFADAQIAEVFLHHRVLIVPVVDSDGDGGVRGVITRSDFFAALARRFLGDTTA